MANRTIWSLSGAGTAGLTTIFSSMGTPATGNMTAASSTYNNQTNLDIYCDIEINLLALSPVAPAYVAVYVLESVDGTNFPVQSDADLRLTSTQLLCAIPVGVTGSLPTEMAGTSPAMTRPHFPDASWPPFVAAIPAHEAVPFQLEMAGTSPP